MKDKILMALMLLVFIIFLAFILMLAVAGGTMANLDYH